MNIIHFEITKEDQYLLESQNLNDSELQNGTVDYSEDILTAETDSTAQNENIVSLFVNSVVNKSLIDSLPNLKLLITRSTGFDHIDLAYAQSKGIIVCNVPSYGSRTVAEFTFALILGLSRKVFQAVEHIKLQHNWDISQFEGFNLQGKTLGIIGGGQIGQNVAQIAQGFNMEVLVYDVFPDEQKAQKFNFHYVALDALLAGSDIVTLHVPATKDTHHMINTANIKRFKKGALLVNTSRGDVIDPEAILAGLQLEILAGVGLDVLEGEHELKEEAMIMAKNTVNQEKLKVLLEDHILMNHPKVIITPHIAFNAKEARHDIITTTMENIHSFLANNPQNTVIIKN